jgi:site-specific recombinase XerD
MERGASMAKINISYHNEQDIKNAQRLRERLVSLPGFCVEFFRSLNDVTSSNTRIGYAYDLAIFFNYLCDNEKVFNALKPERFTYDELSKITADHIENYMDFLTYYEKNEVGVQRAYQNREKGKSRKLSAVRTMFAYFYKKRLIPANPSELVDFPKISAKAITRLEVDEVAKLLDEVESAEGFTKKQKDFHNHTSVRDLALMTLLLGTGLRVSECVGIDINDIDFNINGVKVTRKGGDEVVIYFNDEVRTTLADYLKERAAVSALTGHENALFLSMQKTRITTRSVQNIVKKYSKLVTPLKNITPHKLRSTFGTNLYAETGDIYLVADVLGHEDVNTTRRHYAQIQDSRRRQAAKYVTLRYENEKEEE